MQGLKNLSKKAFGGYGFLKKRKENFLKMWKHGNGILKSESFQKVPGGWEDDEGWGGCE